MWKLIFLHQARLARVLHLWHAGESAQHAHLVQHRRVLYHPPGWCPEARNDAQRHAGMLPTGRQCAQLGGYCCTRRASASWCTEARGDERQRAHVVRSLGGYCSTRRAGARMAHVSGGPPRANVRTPRRVL